MPKVTVIVPVYNVEPYLRRCVDSILLQTFTDFELILVDDGGADECAAICDEFARKELRVQVIHQRNAGVSAARNAGIDVALGTYLMFCDGDDWVSPYWCKVMVSAADEHPNSLIVHQISRVSSDDEKVELLNNNDNQTITMYDLSLKGISCFPFNKIYVRDIICMHNLRFDTERQYGEDAIFVFKYYSFVKSEIILIDSVLYYYYQNQEGASQKYYQNWMELHLEMFYLRIPFLTEQQCVQWCDAWTYSFIRMLDSVFDQRNQMSFIEKLLYNQRMLNSKEVRFCFEHASWKNEGKQIKRILKTYNYFFYFLFQRIEKTRGLIRLK